MHVTNQTLPLGPATRITTLQHFGLRIIYATLRVNVRPSLTDTSPLAATRNVIGPENIAAG